MPKALDAETTAALTDAVRQLEKSSCAEVVVEVRARSGSYAHADARFAAALAFVALLVVIFSPWPFSHLAVVVDVIVAYAIGIFVAKRSNVLRRTFTTRKERDTRVRLVAASLFYERGVANTREEAGLLLYLSLLEKRMEIIADRGVLKAVPSLDWNAMISTIQKREAATPATLIDTMHTLEPMLACHLPSRGENPDELADAPRFEDE